MSDPEVIKAIQDSWREVDRWGRANRESWFDLMLRVNSNSADDLFHLLAGYTEWSPNPTLTFSYNGKPQRITKRAYYRRLIAQLAGVICSRGREMTCLDIRQDEEDHHWWSKERMTVAGDTFARCVSEVGSLGLQSILEISPAYHAALNSGDIAEADIRDKLNLAEVTNAWHIVCSSIPQCVAELSPARAA